MGLDVFDNKIAKVLALTAGLSGFAFGSARAEEAAAEFRKGDPAATAEKDPNPAEAIFKQKLTKIFARLEADFNEQGYLSTFEIPYYFVQYAEEEKLVDKQALEEAKNDRDFFYRSMFLELDEGARSAFKEKLGDLHFGIGLDYYLLNPDKEPPRGSPGEIGEYKEHCAAAVTAIKTKYGDKPISGAQVAIDVAEVFEWNRPPYLGDARIQEIYRRIVGDVKKSFEIVPDGQGRLESAAIRKMIDKYFDSKPTK